MTEEKWGAVPGFEEDEVVPEITEGDMVPGDAQASEAVVISGTDSPGVDFVAGVEMPADETVPGYLEV